MNEKFNLYVLGERGVCKARTKQKQVIRCRKKIGISECV